MKKKTEMQLSAISTICFCFHTTILFSFSENPFPALEYHIREFKESQDANGNRNFAKQKV